MSALIADMHRRHNIKFCLLRSCHRALPMVGPHAFEREPATNPPIGGSLTGIHYSLLPLACQPIPRPSMPPAASPLRAPPYAAWQRNDERHSDSLIITGPKNRGAPASPLTGFLPYISSISKRISTKALNLFPFLRNAGCFRPVFCRPLKCT